MTRTVAASAAANGVTLTPGAAIPRLLVVEGVEYLIEKGCGREMIAAGVIDAPVGGAPPRDEVMRLTERGFLHVVSCFGADRLVDLGLLDPGA